MARDVDLIAQYQSDDEALVNRPNITISPIVVAVGPRGQKGDPGADAENVGPATATEYGTIKLAGDLTGDPAAPTVVGKEPTITAGNSSQYWRGDKTWQTLNKSAVGLGNVQNIDATLRSNHTGTQLAATISDFDTAVANSPALAGKANVSHTHTISDVTGLQTALDAKAADSAVVHKSGDTMTGNLVMDADILMSATRNLTLAQDPSSNLHAATKQYVDALLQGIKAKTSVRVATTANGTLATAFENGDTVDGVTLVTGDRILLKNQSTASENGVYTVNASGAPTRATDADTGAEISGMFVFVQEGITNADTGWLCTNNGSIVVGSTSLTFVQFSSAGVVTAGNGLQQSGTVISINTAITADLTTAQSLTNKTFDNTNVMTLRSDRFTLQDSSDVTKQAVFSLASIPTGTTSTYTFPGGSGTMMTLGSTQTITGVKTFTANPTIAQINGDTASGGNLTLQSTTNATKGKILFGSSGYDEANQRLGVGTNAPAWRLHVAFDDVLSFRADNTNATPSSGGGSGIASGITNNPTAAGQRLGFYLFHNSGNSYAGMLGWSGEAHGASNKGTYLTWETTANVATSRAERMRLNETGLALGSGAGATAGLTLNAAGIGANGIHIYNTTNQTTDYERLRIQYVSNIFTLASEFIGAGVSRALRLSAFGAGVATGYLQMNTSSTAGIVQSQATTNTNGAIIHLINGTIGASAGTQIGLQVSPTLNQSSGAGYSMIQVNPTETAVGTGVKRLLDLLVGGTAKFNVSNDSAVFIGNAAATPGTPTGGGVAYVESGSLKFKGSSGTVTVLAPA